MKNDVTRIPSGLWTTQGGSNLKITIDTDSGLVSGLYSTSHGRPDSDAEFPVTGWVNHDLISLCCSWGDFRSMTTWCGRLYEENDRKVIKYMWHLAREFENADLTVKNDLTFTFHTMSGTFIYHG